jgi:hypothetical protein
MDCYWRIAIDGLLLTDCYWRIAIDGLPLMDYRGWITVDGFPSMDCYRWITVDGFPLIDYRWWITVDGFPLMDCYWWITVDGLPLMDWRWWITVRSVNRCTTDWLLLLMISMRSMDYANTDKLISLMDCYWWIPGDGLPVMDCRWRITVRSVNYCTTGGLLADELVSERWITLLPINRGSWWIATVEELPLMYRCTVNGLLMISADDRLLY